MTDKKVFAIDEAFFLESRRSPLTKPVYFALVSYLDKELSETQTEKLSKKRMKLTVAGGDDDWVEMEVDSVECQRSALGFAYQLLVFIKMDKVDYSLEKKFSIMRFDD